MTQRIAFRLSAALLLPLALLSAPAQAQSAPAAATPETKPAVALTSKVQVERRVTAADGSQTTVLTEAKTVVPGDVLLFTLNYHNQAAAPATDFVVANPLPNAVAFTSVAEDWAEVSVDGGRVFGKLTTLTVAGKDAAGAATTRAATPDDVTHVRWKFAQPIPAGGKGELSFRGVLR